ncbi:MAG: high-potential iron-sulfur protein [Myxococcaceae bacterium]|nr:high-potential iron-sulfur protein [Myxococcaceae bacterium]
MADEPAPPPLPVFGPGEQVCGNCKLWSPISHEPAKGWVGPCRLQPQRNLFPGTAPICDGFKARGQKVEEAQAAQKAARRVALGNIGPTVRRAGAATFLSAADPIRPEDHQQQIDLGGETMTKAELMEVFLEASGLADVPLAAKWTGGSVQLVPGDKALQSKELPIDALFHKVVMVRDRLRTLEQKINGHPKLSDAEKVEMQQYVTRCYGSLTTFNVLFREKGDQFVGQKGDE